MTENKKALENESLNTNDIIAQNNGFVKLFRDIEQWEWYTEPNAMRLFIHCLIKANHASKKWRGVTIHAGSFITSYSKLAQDLKLSEQNIRTALKRLKSTGELTLKATSQYSHISINNWQKYQQFNTQPNTQLTGDQHTTNTQLTTNNNEKNNKNDKNIYIGQNKKFIKPTIQEIETYCLERKNSIDAEAFMDYYTATEWHIGKNPMRDWKAAVRTWERNQKNKECANSNNSNMGGLF